MESDKGEEIKVEPTGNPGSSFSDSSIATLLSAHVSAINTEKQIIWQRYSAMLVVNTIAFYFISRLGDNSPMHAIGGSVFGSTICILWLILNHLGWRHHWDYIRIAAKLSWGQFPNPMHMPKEIFGGKALRRDALYIVAQLIVVVILLVHMLILATTLRTVSCAV